MPLDATVKVTLEATCRKSQSLGTAQDPLLLARSVPLTSGTGAGQADRSFHGRRTLASEAGEDLDLSTLADAFGDAVAMARLRVLYVRNLSSTDGLLVGGAAAGALGLFADAGDVLNLPAQGILLVTAPAAEGVVVGENAKLRCQHAGQTGADLEYEIVLLGASA